MALRVAKHYTELIKLAKAYEDEGELEEAAQSYEQAIRQSPLEEQAYTRLMVIYRKLKQPAKELGVVKKALVVFMDHHDKKVAKYSGKDKVGQLSKALLKSMSGKSKMGVDYPQPVPKWQKRKEAIEKKLK